MKKNRGWLFLTLGVIALPLALIGGFNYYIDPLWCFNHSHKYNQIQIPFDERQQKTNRIHFGPADYDTLVLGSSRTTYMDQEELIGHKAYNYALSIMLLEEYYEYIEYAKQQTGHEFEYIILGLDFFVTNQNLKLQNEFRPPAYYIGISEEFGYRYKHLISLDVLEFSRKNYNASKAGIPVTFDYDRQGRKTLRRLSPEETRTLVAANLTNYEQNIFSNYQYRDVKGILTRLKDANPETRFVVFTTPTARPLWDLMTQQGLLPYYQQWLEDCVAVFGQVYNFDYPNSVTNDLGNFYDASHVYPGVETWIAHKITGYPDKQIPEDFGILLDRDNLASHFKMIESLAR